MLAIATIFITSKTLRCQITLRPSLSAVRGESFSGEAEETVISAQSQYQPHFGVYLANVRVTAHNLLSIAFEDPMAG